jgi:hypothetical protein
MPAWQGSSWKSTLICQPVRDSVFFLAKFRQLATPKKKHSATPKKDFFFKLSKNSSYFLEKKEKKERIR